MINWEKLSSSSPIIYKKKNSKEGLALFILFFKILIILKDKNISWVYINIINFYYLFKKNTNIYNQGEISS